MLRRSGKEKLILQALSYLCSGISYSSVASILKIKRGDLVIWARFYNKSGLYDLVKPPFIVASMFQTRIKRFLEQNEEQFISLMNCDDLELYADWIEVPVEILTAWIIEKEYNGAFVNQNML